MKDTGQEIPDVIARTLPAHCIEWRTLPAGWLVNELGLAGTKIGGAMLAREHGNFIINTGNAKAADVFTLIQLVKNKVREQFGINMQEEVELVGF